MGLLIEHTPRISEMVGLNVEQFDLEGRTFRVYREKTNDWQTHKLKTYTLQAAEVYLHAIGRERGPLFVGYRGQRMQRAELAKRVRLIGGRSAFRGCRPGIAGTSGQRMRWPTTRQSTVCKAVATGPRQ